MHHAIIAAAVFSAAAALAQDGVVLRQESAEPTVEIGSPVVEERPRPSANGMGMGGGGPGMGAPGYRIFWLPSQSVENSDERLGVLRQSFTFGVPVWRGDGQMVLLTSNLRYTLFSGDVTLPDSGQPFPDQLWNVNFGLMWRRQFDNGWSGGASVTVGSASDEPFHSFREVNLGAFAFLEIPTKNERDAWLLSLMYTPTGNLNVPIPGVAYAWRPSDELNVNFGIPFIVKAKPAERWNLSFSYIPVININARATYEWMDDFSLFGGFEWFNEAYFLADRDERRDRFLTFEKRLVAGAKWEVHPKAAIEATGGYAFDRRFAQGQNTLSNLRDVVDVEPGSFLGLNLLLKR